LNVNTNCEERVNSSSLGKQRKKDSNGKAAGKRPKAAVSPVKVTEKLERELRESEQRFKVVALPI
jgi:hypothetical protein